MTNRYIKRMVILAFAFMILIAGIGCKKDKSDDNGGNVFMKFKMDGEQINWTEGFSEHLTSDLNIISASGFSSNSSNAETLTVTIANDGPTDTGVEYAYPSFNVRMSYTNPNNVHYTSDNLVAFMQVSAETSSEIAGTFRGTIKNDGGDEIVITEGSFKLSKNR